MEYLSLSPHPQIEERLFPLRDRLLNHPIYGEFDRLPALQLFMEHHVYAVWDFMSLLKGLQRRLCCVEVPWLPPVNLRGCRLINEIVLAEESDDDGRGGFASHFDLYHRSMVQCGADTSVIDRFLNQLREGAAVLPALETSGFPDPARKFVQQTFRILESNNLVAIASAFTFGREDLLPDVFQRIVDRLNSEAGGRLEEFKYYLVRHIGLDGDEHGPMATQLMRSLCGDDPALWEVAGRTAEECLRARLELWDGIHSAILQSRKTH